MNLVLSLLSHSLNNKKLIQLFLDYGLDILTSRIEESTFPWILSNVFDAETKKPLGDVEDRKIVEINGYRVILHI